MPSMKQTDETIAKSIARSKFSKTNRTTVFNARQQKIVRLLLDDFFGNLNVSKYAKITKTSTNTAVRDLKYLIKKDVLEQLGEGRSTSYKIKKSLVIINSIIFSKTQSKKHFNPLFLRHGKEDNK